ncbi:MAG TPA: pitrilysin family protein [Polyangiaceae bacterium]|jgi:zinc protease|nr:pitrilysin family protein [Polyangiaceae bacterium]
MRNARAALAVTLGLCAGLPASVARGKTAADASHTEHAAAVDPRATAIAFEKFKLANGLTVILHSDRSLPLVAVNVWYHVGPANEPAHRSGFAHLFEHLMFEGSKYVGHEFDRILESIGATNSNGTTSWDRTNYFETAPSENLETLLWLESDRMGFMIDTLTEERLDVQRDVVKNERRQSYENAPYGPSSLTMLNALFPEGHPYNGAVIGSMADLSAATLKDVTEFFRQYYAPSNATLCVAGDLDPTRTKALIERYFGTLPDRKRPEVKALPYSPLPKAERVVVKEQVTLAQVSFGYRTPPAFSADDPALDVAMAILGGGKATRLYQRLVVQTKLAADVSASLESNQLASIASLSATVASGKSSAAVERELDAVLAQLQKNGPSAAELARAKRRILVGALSSLELLNGPGGDSGRSGLLQRFDQYTGDPGYLPTWLAQIERVEAKDVQRVIKQSLRADARVVVITEPVPPPASTQEAP